MIARFDRVSLIEFNSAVNVPLSVIQELVVEATMVVLEVYKRALAEVVMMLDILVGVTVCLSQASSMAR